MRVVVLASSPYSETGCAMAARLAQLGQTVAGAISLPAWDRGTLLRKLAQWGWRDSWRFAWSKLAPAKRTTPAKLHNSYLRNAYFEDALRQGSKVLRNLHEVGKAYGFPLQIYADQNSPAAMAQVKLWSADVAVFTGGNILRKQLLQTPRLGVLNSHLALLPEIRGMSSPEWSLVCGVPLGVTIHQMDAGIDTGPILIRREIPHSGECGSLIDLRNRMIAFGIEMMGEAIAGLEAGAIVPARQAGCARDTQYFVMHERLKSAAAGSLAQAGSAAAEKCRG